MHRDFVSLNKALSKLGSEFYGYLIELNRRRFQTLLKRRIKHLADNDEYDDCEEFYYTVDCDLQNKRIETMVHIANYVLSCGYPLEFFMGLSGKCSETEFAHCKVTVAELERELKTYFSSNDGDSRNGFFDAVRITITR